MSCKTLDKLGWSELSYNVYWKYELHDKKKTELKLKLSTKTKQMKLLQSKIVFEENNFSF